MPAIYDKSPTADELEILRESDGFVELKDSTAFATLCAYMDELVREAETEKNDNLSSDAQIAWNLQWRWRQRRDMTLAVKNYVDYMIQSRKEVLQTLEETNGNTSAE